MRRISATGDQRGFSLLELMLVVVIIGLLTATVSLVVPDSAQRQLDEAAKRFYALVAQARDQAIYRNKDYGVLLEPQGYRFLLRSGEAWIDPQPGERLGAVRFDETITPTLTLGGQLVAIDGRTPQIYIASDGQVSPFELQLSHDALATSQWIRADFGGDLQLLLEPAL